MSVTRIRRALVLAGAVAVFLVLAGATYQGVATAFERRRFPHPGQLADVGGHQLHLYCTGEGTPTVLLEAPAAGLSAAWGWVQPAVARTTRVCSYDRAGLGWSEAGNGTFVPAAVPEQLHALITRTGERAPFVFAGQGFGAALARLDAARFGDDTAALVLIDPPTGPQSGAASDGMTHLVAMSPWLARAGVLRATRLLSEHAGGLPEPAAGALTAFLNRPDHLTRAALEIASWNQVIAQSSAVALPSNVSVVEIAVAGSDRVAFLAQQTQANAAARAITDAVGAARVR